MEVLWKSQKEWARSNSPGAPGGLGKTGGLIPGISGWLPGICAFPGIGNLGGGNTGGRLGLWTIRWL